VFVIWLTLLIEYAPLLSPVRLPAFFRGAGEKDFTTILQIKTFTAIGPLEQAFHFPRSGDQIVHFRYLALREYLPAVECRDPSPESVEKEPHLINSEPCSLGHIDDCQVVEDPGFITALTAYALSFREQANLLVIPDCGSSQTCPAGHLANGYVCHMKKKQSLDLNCTLSPRVATEA
jgi:hypothetical protein